MKYWCLKIFFNKNGKIDQKNIDFIKDLISDINVNFQIPILINDLSELKYYADFVGFPLIIKSKMQKNKNMIICNFKDLDIFLNNIEEDQILKYNKIKISKINDINKIIVKITCKTDGYLTKIIKIKLNKLFKKLNKRNMEKINFKLGIICENTAKISRIFEINDTFDITWTIEWSSLICLKNIRLKNIDNH